MDEEEDIIFDQTTLLTKRVKKSSHHNHRPGRCFRIFQTLLLCAAFFGLGLCIAIPGPTLLDLQTNTKTNTSQISQVFTGRSVGYLVGSVLGGFFYDRFNQNCLLFFSLLLTAIGTAMAPWSHSFLLLMGFIALQGLSMGFLDTGGNVLCVTIWGRQSPPYLQSLHFTFGLGAFVAPLIAEPFLAVPLLSSATNDIMSNHSPGNMEPNYRQNNSAGGIVITHKTMKQPIHQRHKRQKSDDHNVTLSHSKKPLTHDKALSSDADGTKLAKSIKKTKQDAPPPPLRTTVKTTVSGSRPPDDSKATITTTTAATTTTTHPTTTSQLPSKNPASNIKQHIEAHDQNITINNETNAKNGSSKQFDIMKKITELSNVQFAYLAIALYLGVVAICFLCVCCLRKQGLHVIRNEEVQSEYLIRKETQGFRVQILVLLFLFYFLYVGMEVTYGGLIMTFSVKYLNWTKSQGTLLTSVFWGSFALARGIAIFFGMCLSPALMLIADLVLTCLALAGLVMALESNHMILWFCTAVLGAGMASIFPAGITWAERYMHITGKATSVFVVGSALGEMIVPALTGFLFEAKGPMWLLYIMLGAGLFAAVLYIIMQNLASNKGERYEKLTHWLGSSSADSGGEEQELEMDVVDSTNSGLSNRQGAAYSPVSANGKKKVSFNLPKDLTPKNIANRYRSSFIHKGPEKHD